MNFFEHQEKAKKNTFWLIFLFSLAVIGIILVCYLIVAFAMHGAMGEGYYDPSLFLGTTFIVLVIVGLATLFKTAQLSAGGKVIAEELGGRLLNPNSGDFTERKILNVVEEMAIASGVSTPPVYLMDKEQGINAFAAGFSPDDAVIGVTRGTVELLSRDELQGVIAHEFSHILNGDMRINIRLIGILFGILVLGMMGYYALRSSAYSRSSRGQAGAAIPIIGLGLIIVGSIGTLFGNLIKAAVSRQREYLADASAVQFTRNPEGIGEALKKIRDHTSKIKSPNAPDASHMFFASGLSSLFATHPPINERIRRVYGLEVAEEGPELPVAVGQESIAAASQLIGAIPEGFKEAAREPYGSRALIYALLLSKDETVRKGQLKTLENQAEKAVYHEISTRLDELLKIKPEERLSLVDLAFPALSMLSLDQYVHFKANIEAISQMETPFEWVVQRLIKKHLDPQFYPKKKKRTRFQQIHTMTEAVTIFLAFLTRHGHEDKKMQLKSYSAAMKKLDLPYHEPRVPSFSQLDRAVDQLKTLSPKDKKRFLDACLASIHSDQEINVHEKELIRAVSDALDCPISLHPVP